MKKFIFLFALLGGSLFAVSPVPFTEGVSFSVRLVGTGSGTLTLFGEGDAVATAGAVDAGEAETAFATAWLRPGKVYRLTFASPGLTAYHVSLIAPSGYTVYLNGAATSYLVREPAGGISDDEFTVELRADADAGGEDFAAFSGIQLGKSIGFQIGLGTFYNGRSAGHLVFRELELPAGRVARARLYCAIPPNHGGCTAIRDGAARQVVRQVEAPQGFVDVLDTENGYTVRFFHRAQVEGRPDGPSIVYGEPWKTIRVEQPAADQLRITERIGSRTRVSELVITRPAVDRSLWTLTEGDGTTVGRTTVHSSLTVGRVREVTITVATGSGPVVSRMQWRYEQQPWGEEVVAVAADAAVPSASTVWIGQRAFSYHTDPTRRGNYRRVRTVTEATGNWVLSDYYDDWATRGQLRREYRPFADAPALPTDDPSRGRVTTCAWAADWTGRNARPASRVEQIDGRTTARTTWTHGDREGDGWPREYSFTTLHSSEAIAETSYDERFRADAGLTDGLLPYVVRSAYGTQTSHSFLGGTFDPGAARFSAAGMGYYRHVAVQGTTNPAGAELVAEWDGQSFAPLYLVPGRSTLDAAIADRAGNVVRTETWFYAGAGHFSLMAWENRTYDETGRALATVAANGATTTRSYTDGLLTRTVAPDGVETTYDYDLLGRVRRTTKVGTTALVSALTPTATYEAQPDVHTHFTYDGADRVVESVVTGSAVKPAPGGEFDLWSTSTFDCVGRTRTTTTFAFTPRAQVTSYDYHTPAERKVTTTSPDGATSIAQSHVDGRLKSVTGTAQVHAHYGYRVQATGELVRDTWLGERGSRAWRGEVFNWAGRLWQDWRLGGDGNYAAEFHDYTPGGMRDFTWFSDGRATRLIEYNSLGQLFREGDDRNGNGVLDCASDEPVTENSASYQVDSSGRACRVTTSHVYAAENSDRATLLSSTTECLTQLGTGVLAFSSTRDRHGNTTTTTVTLDRPNKRVSSVVDHPDSTKDAVSVAHNGLGVERQDSSGLCFRTKFDVLGRPVRANDPRLGDTTTTYYPGTTLVAKIYNAAATARLISAPATLATTELDYDAAGRVIASKNALGKTAYAAYSLRGELVRQWGATTLPVEHAYDQFGRRWLMKTYRTTGVNWSQATWPAAPGTPSLTRWVYDDATGNLLEKYDAKNLQADGTPVANAKKVSYTYTSANQVRTRTWARGVRTTYAYETRTRRLSTIDYDNTAATVDVAYTYDRLGQVATVTDQATGTRTFRYNLAGALELQAEELGSFYSGYRITQGYDTSAGVVGRQNSLGVTNSAGVSEGYTVDLRYDVLGRPNGVGAFTYSYTPDSALIAESSSTTFRVRQVRTYLPRANVVDVVSNYVNGLPLATFDQTHDDLNRVVTSLKSGSQFQTNYSAALRNTIGYDDRSQVSTDRTNYANLTGRLVDNRSSLFTYDPAGNRVVAQMRGVTSYYLTGPGNEYQSVSNLGAMVHDDDGNLLSDNVWTNTYDAENRVVRQLSATQRIEHRYDYQGRRVEKIVYTGTTLTSDIKFLYHGCNLIHELDGLRSNAKLRVYVWGLDVSGTGQGAGGVGGLLYYYDYTTSQTICPHYDYNGNVIALTNSLGLSVGYFEYDAFGRTDSSGGTAAALNRFRFSTKYTDAETGYLYYGHRFYHPTLGRFINRDPSGEAGGLNLYAFCANNAVNSYDYLGLDAEIIGEDGGAPAVTGLVLAGLDRMVASQSDIAKTWNEKFGDFLDRYHDPLATSPVEDLANTRAAAFDQRVAEAHTGAIQAQQILAAAGISFSDDPKQGSLLCFNWGTGLASGTVGRVLESVIAAADRVRGPLKAYLVRSVDGKKWDIVKEVDEVTTAYAYVNGITGTLQRHADLGGAHMPEGVREFTLFNNPSYGFFADLVESALDKLGLSSRPARQLADIMEKQTLAGRSVQWIAHSQGGAIFAEAMRIADTKLTGQSVSFHAGANNRAVTNRIAREAGVTVKGYFYSPLDLVPNVIGANGNPITMLLSLIFSPTLWFERLSPHTKPRKDWRRH